MSRNEFGVDPEYEAYMADVGAENLAKSREHPEPTPDVCPEYSWKEGYFVNNKGETCPVCKGTGLKPPPEKIIRCPVCGLEFLDSVIQEHEAECFSKQMDR